METNKLHECLNCKRNENEVPLVSVKYSGADTFICSECLPQLIHHRENLSDKLKEVSSK